MRAKPSSYAVTNIILAIVLALSGVLGFSRQAAAEDAASPALAAAGDLFFSEYIEGSSNNKALEIYNATGASVDLGAGGYNVQIFFNGNSSAGLTINLTGTVVDGDVFVLAQSSANTTILAHADQTNGSGWFNGDDAVVLRKGTTILDAFGQIGFDPGAEWGSSLVSTADNTLRRKSSVCAGDVDGSNVFDPAVEWDGFATDTLDGLGVHKSNCYAAVVISQVYGGGGNSGATLKNDFIELYNRSGFAVDITGWSVQYASSSGISWSRTILSGTIQPGNYYLIQQAAGAGGTINLPTPNATGTIAMSGTAGKVALVSNSTALSGSCPISSMVDLVGYGTANCFEGSGPAPALSNTTAALRAGNGAIDTDNNASDFTAGTPNPRNTPPPLPNLTVNDVSANEGNSDTTSFDFTVSLSAPAPAGGVTFDIATADGTATVADNDYTAVSLVGQTIPAGSSSYNFSVVVNGDTITEPDESFFVNVTNVTGAAAADGQGEGTIVNDDFVITAVHEIQGSGSTAEEGTFTVEAIVVGDYQTQGSGQLRGFFIQEEDVDADADPATSEGIFVFCTTCPVAVNVGDQVRVTGATSEFFDMSQLSASTVTSVSVLSSSNPLPTPASIQLPVPGVPGGDLTAAKAYINAYYEPFEGMLVTFPATLSVSEYFELARYGQVILNEGGRPHTYTAVNTPTAAGYIDHQINLASRKVILDDTDNRQNRPSAIPNTAYYHPVPGLSTSNYFRGGDTITNLTGVLHWSFAGQGGTDAWRIRPVTEAYSYAFSPVNTRPAVPTVGGSLKVASFNVLNYFLTIDTSNICAPSQNQDCRGADSAQELERQRTKLLSALAAIDADVFGFMEMENTPGVEPLADLVAGLPGYAYVDTGVIGTDAIRVGIIYKTATVVPVGDYAVLTSAVDPRFIDTRNRPALAQSFEEISSGGRFTVVVNHLKSKGSGCGVGDDDTTTGQGNCNGTRTQAALALADWLATDPTGSGDADVLIIGDLNSYAREDPIVALQNAGYTDLVAAYGGSSAYGYVFDGQLGYLDHALSNVSLTPQVVGVAEWHINADEIPLFDYNDDVRTADEASFEEESDALPLYEPTAFRTSDHDPVLIGLNLNGRPTLTADPASQSVQYSDPIAEVTVTGSDAASDLPLDLTYESNFNGGDFSAGLPAGLSFSDDGCTSSACTWTLSGVALLPPGVYVVRVTATDPEDLFSTIDITLTVTQEDARAFYTGAEYASTANESSSTATVTLSATIKDISVTVDAGGDVYPGDITNAVVKFVDRENNDAVFCTVPVGLVDLNDSATGTATCNLEVDLGSADSLSMQVGVVVSGYYTRDSSEDDALITVSRAYAGNFITGGGSLLLENSAGQIAGDPGSRNNFGFNVKFNKSGKNLQGRLTTLVRSGGHTYQIKTNVLTSLSVNQPCTDVCTAVFNGKATIQDITDPNNPIEVDGGAALQVTLTDNGSGSDSIGITVWNKEGGLWFASSWDGTRTLEQNLAGGNVIVH